MLTVVEVYVFHKKKKDYLKKNIDYYEIFKNYCPTFPELDFR